MRELDFADTIDDGSPEISQYREGFAGHHRFIEHFPNHREFDQSAGAAFAGHEAVGETDQLKQTILPGADADFDVHPGIGLGGKEIRGDAVGFAASLLGATRDSSHDTTVGAAAYREPGGGKRAAKRARFFVLRLAFERSRATEDGDDFFLGHVGALGAASEDPFLPAPAAVSGRILPSWR